MKEIAIDTSHKPYQLVVWWVGWPAKPYGEFWAYDLKGTWEWALLFRVHSVGEYIVNKVKPRGGSKLGK